MRVKANNLQRYQLAVFSHKATFWVALVLLGLLLAGCNVAPRDDFIANNKYTVKRNDTLQLIAWRYGLDYRQVAAWNGLKKPYEVYPGTRLYLSAPAGFQPVTPGTQAPSQVVLPAPQAPKPELVTQPTPKPPVSPSKPYVPPVAVAKPPKPVTPVTPAKPKPKTPPVSKPTPVKSVGGIVWNWPATGNLLKKFERKAGSKKGIDIAGKIGESVKAAAPGEVVYSGSGLVGYGRLIIINHNDNFLSAYAHNNKLLVKEGENVQQGQQIAELGKSGTDIPKLHFEIRHNGEPVDPLRYLPSR